MFNTLLQLLDDGRLTDGQGRTVSFSNTVIIMTSNLGAEHLLAALSEDTTIKAAKENVMQEVCPFISWTLCASFSYKYHEDDCGVLTRFSLNVVAG